MKRIVFVVITITMFLSCSTPQQLLYRLDLTPINTESLWNNGNQITSANTASWQLGLCYRGVKDNYLEFDITICNTGIDTFLIDPNSINYTAEVLLNDTSSYMINGNCVDPELTINEIELHKKRVELKTNPYKESGLELGLGLVASVIEIATIFKKDTRTQEQKEKDEEEDRRRKYNEEIRENNRIQWDISHTNEINTLEQKALFFKTNALRKTTLLPSEKITGLFYCSYYTKAKTIDFMFTLNGTSKSIQYKQNAVYR